MGFQVVFSVKNVQRFSCGLLVAQWPTTPVNKLFPEPGQNRVKMYFPCPFDSQKMLEMSHCTLTVHQNVFLILQLSPAILTILLRKNYSLLLVKNIFCIDIGLKSSNRHSQHHSIQCLRPLGHSEVLSILQTFTYQIILVS